MTVTGPVRSVERSVGKSDAAVALPRRSFFGSRKPGLSAGLIGMALLAGPANVIMQLARPGVGYGVIESRVESGRIDLHPIKRARTTFTYLAVATMGTDEQKAAFRRAVNQAHAQVYSTPDSPVSYNAFDPELQLWVAACLYKGAVDVYRMFVGEMDEELADQHYRQGMTLGTTLQVPPEIWPANRAAFDKYWQASLQRVRIDDTVRAYLYPIAAARPAFPVPRLMRKPLESFSILITTGFLPQRFRDEMRLPWTARRQKLFDRVIAVLRVVTMLSPRPLREFPFNVLLRDLDWRIRTGRPLV
ncbi:oxygenase MpaB family protein [Mycobacterium sp.]|jgi:uncharacterized protein (DUF2236 family)|uniref:oxygenase MpaB family protein n=1 Tax=Mycobacterium sp. TaxID=1785 RepID=UPI002D49183B|nr:oxygenase MpaB family protein [Mycobacterium sp.]HZA12184.1 oxygenase MpaB family protein [Mycobacterium sp.]